MLIVLCFERSSSFLVKIAVSGILKQLRVVRKSGNEKKEKRKLKKKKNLLKIKVAALFLLHKNSS